MKEVQNESKRTDQADFEDHAWRLMTLKEQIKRPKTKWILPCIIAVLWGISGVGYAIYSERIESLIIIPPFLALIAALVSIETERTNKRFDQLLELLELEKEINSKEKGANKTVDTIRVSARRNPDTLDTLNPNPTIEI